MAGKSKSARRQKRQRVPTTKVIQAEHRVQKSHLAGERAKLLQAQERSMERVDELDPGMYGEEFDNEEVLKLLDFEGYFRLSLTIDMNKSRLERLEEQIQYKKADFLQYTDGSILSSNHSTMGCIINDLREEEVEYREIYLTEAAYDVEWILEQLLSLHYIRTALQMRSDIGWFGAELNYERLTQWAEEEKARAKWEVYDWVAIWRRAYCCAARYGLIALDECDQKSLECAGLAPLKKSNQNKPKWADLAPLMKKRSKALGCPGLAPYYKFNVQA